MRTALGDERVQQVAKSLGIPMDNALDVLAKFLPAAANAAGSAVAPPSPAGGINRDNTRLQTDRPCEYLKKNDLSRSLE